MLINVFDFTTNSELRQYDIDMSASEENINKHSILHSLARSLICPKNNDNRTSYIQNCESPEIGDIINGDGVTYENTFLISEIFDVLETNNNDASSNLRKYFEYQYADIFSGNKQDDNFNVVLIPDVFRPIIQEHILSSGVFRRENTTLLWRSVASVIGIDFEKKGAAEGDNILVVDTYFGKCYGTILTLKEHKCRLVPQRKAYIKKNKKTNYPYIDYSQKPITVPDNVFDFFLRTFWGSKKEKFYAPTDGFWNEYDTPKIENLANITPQNLDGIKYCVTLGNIRSDIPSSFPKEDIVFDYDCSSAFKGAAKFYYKREKKLPTYLDQCEALKLIVQDKDENIVTKTLIPKNDECEGGEVVEGIVNKDCYLEPQNKSAKFYLILGDEDSDLKELEQNIGKESLNKQNLTLASSMIPGQGIAVVQVDASPLIKDRIKLDFLKMKDSDETIETLQEKLKRSFPVDMPKVKADSTLWNKSIPLVEKYLNDGINFGNRNKIKSMFRKPRYSNTKATGIERFRRKNVFGNEPMHELPDVDKEILSRLRQKLHKDYFNYYNTEFQSNIVNIIAWMYINDKDESFKDVVEDVLKQVEQAANSNGRIGKQYLTFCANTLTNNELVVRYFNATCLKLKKSLVEHSVKSTDWIRCLGEMLMFNNDMLSIFSDCKPLTIKPEYTCADCMWYLIKTFELWTKTDRDVASFRYILKAMLFLLKYRKYDKSFIRKDNETTSDLYNTILASTDVEKIKNLSCFYKINDLVCKFRDFIEGNGTLEGIPTDND